ncbi:hypothetical protein D7V82_10435 [bacterium 1xD8-6]|nr:hypothetical protein D7V72_13030 [bacterium D16-36]RKI68979.1 hypothetical protein D7V82_10435 [bacterium 1xD8-6]
MYGSVSGNAEENKSKSVLFLRQRNARKERSIRNTFFIIAQKETEWEMIFREKHGKRISTKCTKSHFKSSEYCF